MEGKCSQQLSLSVRKVSLAKTTAVHRKNKVQTVSYRKGHPTALPCTWVHISSQCCLMSVGISGETGGGLGHGGRKREGEKGREGKREGGRERERGFIRMAYSLINQLQTSPSMAVYQ